MTASGSIPIGSACPTMPMASDGPPSTRTGWWRGSSPPDGRLVVDSGLFNSDLLKADYGDEAARLFRRSRSTSGWMRSSPTSTRSIAMA